MEKLKMPKIVDVKMAIHTNSEEYYVKFKGGEWEEVSEKDFIVAAQILTTSK